MATVQPRSITSYTYDNNEIQEKQFTYKLSETGQEHSIPAQNIIAIVPSTLSLTDPEDESHTLFYTSRDTSDPDSVPESTTTLHTLTLPDPPTQDLLQDHSPPSHSHLAHLYQQEHDTTLNPRDKDTLRIIISTGSGTQQAQTYYKNLLGPLLHHLNLTRAAKIHTTTSAESIANLTRQNILPYAQAGRAQTLILLAGDGGVVDLVNALLDSAQKQPQNERDAYARPTVCLLALGTGNALANSARVTTTAPPTLGLRTLLHGSPRALPLFRVAFSGASFVEPGSGSAAYKESDGGEGGQIGSRTYAPRTMHGAVVASWALHAALVADSDTAAYREHGAARFKMAAMDNVFPRGGSAPHAYKGKVSVRRRHDSSGDERAWEELQASGDGFAYLLVTPCKYLEAGFCISPSSRPLDGVLWLVALGMPQHKSSKEGERAGDRLMEVMGNAYDEGKHIEAEDVQYEAVEGLKIEFDEDEERWRRVCIDGSIYVVEKGGSVEIVRDDTVVVDLVITETD